MITEKDMLKINVTVPSAFDNGWYRSEERRVIECSKIADEHSNILLKASEVYVKGELNKTINILLTYISQQEKTLRGIK